MVICTLKTGITPELERLHMHVRYRPSLILSISLLFVLLSVVLAACGGGSTSTSTGSNTGTSLKDVSIGLGYIPNIQFAPFYVAQSKGYYKAAGLNVTFHHGFVNDVI